MNVHGLVAAVSAIAIAGMILRPAGLAEPVWACAGAALLVVLGRISLAAAWHGITRGTDVYLFLTGMMLLSEVARSRGLFDWLASCAVRRARGSAARLFSLIYGVGIVVTALLSNDATAVVLTPAVAVAAQAAGVRNPLPYLLICAFIANAASFILPISNPANLVMYHSAMPPLPRWLAIYGLPSLAAVAATYAMLRGTQRHGLRDEIATDIALPPLSAGGRTAAWGIGATAVVLLVTSGLGGDLGLPTAITGAITAAIVLGRERAAPWPLVRGISWGVLPLVAGLFVLVAGLQQSGLTGALAALLHRAAAGGATATAWGAGAAIGLVCNLVNNLPAGLIAASVVQPGKTMAHVTGALLVGVDLGPNLSVSGSLATILWLTALRREGVTMSAWEFLKIGVCVMPPALIAALAALIAG